MEFVKAVPSDITEIMPLVNEAVSFMNASGNFQWDTGYPSQTVFENDILSGHLYLTRYGTNLAGFVCLNFDQPLEYNNLNWTTSSNALVIHRMVVSKEYRGKGVAKFMFQNAEIRAQKLNVSTIRSDTNSENKAMNHLFKIFTYRFAGNISLRNNPVAFNCFEKNIRQ